MNLCYTISVASAQTREVGMAENLLYNLTTLTVFLTTTELKT